MSIDRWEPGFTTSTRGEIVELLRRGPMTVEALARSLELTGNAIRSHLSILERDGLVEHRRVRRGVGKPAHLYQITAETEHLFARAYAPVLNELLDVLIDQYGEESLQDTLRSVGRRLADVPGDEPDLETRLNDAVDLWNRLGGLAECETCRDHVTIRGHGCPLTAISANHDSICQLAEALISEIVGFPMHERCERGDRPRCRFEGTIT